MAWAEVLHPDVWRADQLAAPPTPCAPTGWAALDAMLPGGGWPLGALVEWVVPAHTLPWRLLQPALQTATQQGLLALIGLPLEPQLAVWAAHGIDPSRLVRVQPHDDAQGCWAAEQALACPQVTLCWLHLHQPSVAALRRLHQAAARARCDATQPGAWPAPLVLCSVPEATALSATPAPLRLQLQGSTADGVTIRVRKRRGPPLPGPVHIAAALPWAAWVRVAPAHARSRLRQRLTAVQPAAACPQAPTAAPPG
ncbi:cell division protein [Tepidimonas sp.]|uniref:cell division protein n=1 Tax=Tepidimonas sp. TaxID=2002775 RepID=UPI002FE3F6C6